MATALPPTTPQDEDERYNTAQHLADAEFNGGTKTGSDSYADSGIDQAEAFANDPVNAVRQQEAKAANPMGYEATGRQQSAASRATELAGAVKNPIKFLNIAKKGGPTGIIIAILAGAIGLTSSFSALLPLHLLESFMDRFDTSTTSYTLRTDRLLVNKLVDKGTQGNCNVTKIFCRFQRPSNYMLKQLESNNVTPLDKNGNKIEKKTAWPNARPTQYAYTGQDGKVITIRAADLKQTLANNAEFRSAYHSALKTRLQIFSDSIFKSVAFKYGFTKQDTLKDATSEDDVNKRVRQQTAGEESDGTDDKNGPKKESKTKEELQNTIQGEADKEVAKISRSGSAVGLVAGGVCLLSDGPGVVTRAARAYQLAQVVRFGALFMTMASAVKAGDGHQQAVSAYANSLTTVVDGKSAMDSFGMRYTLFGDTSANDDKNYKKYAPGGAVAAIFGPAAAIFDSQEKKNVCRVATSPVTGLAIDAALAPTTLGIGTLINVAGGVLGGLAIGAVVSAVLPQVLDLIPAQVYEDLAKMVFGDITADLNGQAFGNALASGTSNTLGQLANAGGNVPLGVDDAVAYDGLMKSVNLAYAQEDRATLNPLDATNKNTMMGSFVNKLLPIYGKLGSFTGIASSLTSITSSSVMGLVSGPSYAATVTDPKQYQLCDDPSVTNAAEESVAAGPFCNIQYGIPAQYINLDPQTIVEDLVKAGQIDEDTGEAKQDAGAFTSTAADVLGIPKDENSEITSYYDWLQTCTDGTSDQAVNCRITNKQVAEYALYTIDHRIQKNVDDEDVEPTAAGEGDLGLGGCEAGNGIKYGTPEHPFDCKSPWNTPLPKNPVIDPNSGAISKAVLTANDRVVNMILYAFGQPVYTSTATTPYATVGGRGPHFNLPLDPSWRPNAGADSKMNIFDTKTGTSYELQGYNQNDKSAYWGVKHNYVTGLADGYPTNGEGAGPTGSGMSQLAGMVRISDIKSGKIEHALSFITSDPQAGAFRYPASGTDGKRTAPYGIAEGMRIQLDPTLNVDTLPGITAGEKMVAKALQKYGAYCTDTGGGNNMAMGFYAEKPTTTADPYPGVGFNGDWAQLTHVPRDRYRVVDASVTKRP